MLLLGCIAMHRDCLCDKSIDARRDGELETFELSEDFVNPGQPQTRPQDFELLKLLGKGGYGKVVPYWMASLFLSYRIMICIADNNICNY